MGSVGLTTILFVTPGVCLIGCFIYYYTGGEDGPMTTVLSYFNKFLPWNEWTDFLPLSDCLHLILSVFGIKRINFYVFYGNHYMSWCKHTRSTILLFIQLKNVLISSDTHRMLRCYQPITWFNTTANWNECLVWIWLVVHSWTCKAVLELIFYFPQFLCITSICATTFCNYVCRGVV